MHSQHNKSTSGHAANISRNPPRHFSQLKARPIPLIETPAYRTTFRLLRTKITIDFLFPCKQIILPRFLRMQLTLLVTGKNE